MSDAMTPAPDATAEVKKRRSGLMVALLGILVVLAAIVGVAYATGIGPFATTEDEPAVVTPTPTAETGEAEEETTTSAAAATVPLPPAEAQEVMYWEQVASAEKIGELVGDKFEKFELSQIATGAEKADIRVTATYRDGSTMSGWLMLRQYEGAWYFASITADGGDATTPDLGDPDADVMKAMVEQQAANQDVYIGILNGTYTTITITRVTAGSGTAMMDITLSGSGATQTKGQITCISKDANGTTQWFITAFSKL